MLLKIQDISLIIFLPVITLRKGFFSIGIIPGETITVGDISSWGPVTVISKGIKIALGRGVASKISLRQISGPGDKT